MILCIGTTPTMQRTMIFDRLVLDEVNRTSAVREYASGKAGNVARVAKALGHDVLHLGFAGGDRGRALLDDFARLGIRHDFVTTAARTRLCTTVIDQATGQVTELVEETQPVELEAWSRLDEKIAGHGPHAGVWVFSGSLPPGAPVEHYAQWVARAVKSGATVILDARGEIVRLSLQQGPLILKLNRSELAATLGADLSSELALHDALRRTVPRDGAIIVTLGADGAVAFDGCHLLRVTHPKVRALNPIGSGDSFAGGLAAAVESDKSFEDQLRLATACAVANALTAEAGEVEPDVVHNLFGKIDVAPV